MWKFFSFLYFAERENMIFVSEKQEINKLWRKKNTDRPMEMETDIKKDGFLQQPQDWRTTASPGHTCQQICIFIRHKILIDHWTELEKTRPLWKYFSTPQYNFTYYRVSQKKILFRKIAKPWLNGHSEVCKGIIGGPNRCRHIEDMW